MRTDPALAAARRTSSLNPPAAQDLPNTAPPPPRRIVIDTDCANEADDQFAVVHALLSPTLDVRCLVAAHFGLRRSTTSMADSHAELLRLTSLLGDGTPVLEGASTWIPDERTPLDSPGARAIVEECLREDAGGLVVAVLGPLTNVASAILLEPRLLEREVTVIWIGGPAYDGLLGRTGGQAGVEFNLSNDIDAANVVLASGIDVIQVPDSTYRMCAVGYAELEQKVAPCGPVGRYLVDQLLAWNARWNRTAIEHRSLGDSPAVGLALNPGGGVMRRRPAPRFAADGSVQAGPVGRHVTVCEAYDTRYLFEDMFAKIRRHADGTSSTSGGAERTGTG